MGKEIEEFLGLDEEKIKKEDMKHSLIYQQSRV